MISSEPSEHERIVEAYLSMAKEANYRPIAPGDGFGCVLLSEEELGDKWILLREAEKYAREFIKTEDNGGEFSIGISNYETNRALVYTIEAAKIMCGAGPESLIEKLLQMALIEITSPSEPDTSHSTPAPVAGR